MLTSTADVVSKEAVPLSARLLPKFLVEALASRISMLLNAEKTLPIFGGRAFSGVMANEFVISLYLSPRYVTAMQLCYGYSENSIVAELSRLYNEKFPSDTIEEATVLNN